LILTNNSEQLDDFITLQKVNIKRLESNLNYVVTSSELSDIYNIAIKNHPYSTYGKSLYYWITGEILSTDLPPIIAESEQQERRSAEEIDREVKVEMFPNPFSNSLSLELQNNSSEMLTIIIDDILGRGFFEQKTIESEMDINTNNWGEGIYMLHLYNGDILLESRKLILSK